MLRRALFGLLAAVLWGLPTGADAEVFEDARILRAGSFRIGFEPQIMFGPERPRGLIGFTRFGFGVGSATHVEIVGGFFQPRLYMGAEVKFGLLPDGPGYPGLAVRTGAHFWYGEIEGGNPGLDFTLLVSEEIRPPVHLYGALDANMEILGARVRLPIRSVFGVNIVMNHHMSLRFEAGIGLFQSPHHISGGPAIVF